MGSGAQTCLSAQVVFLQIVATIETLSDLLTALGKCDPASLPNLQNGRKDPYKTTQYRGAVYRYSCARGYKRLGTSLVHCTGNHWDLQRVPICSSIVMMLVIELYNSCVLGAGCDETLMTDLPDGQSKRRAHGGVYYFRCREGSVLVGSSVVVCDGKLWNDTAPVCFSKLQVFIWKFPSY